MRLPPKRKTDKKSHQGQIAHNVTKLLHWILSNEFMVEELAEMALKKSIGKLDAYYDRLQDDKAKQIKPGHVEKVLGKLAAKEEALLEDLAKTHKDSKKKRLKGKLDVVREQIKRGKWLLKHVGGTS